MPCGHGTPSYHGCIRRIRLRCFSQSAGIGGPGLREVLQEELYKHSFSKVVFALKVMEGPTIIIMCFPRCLGRR